MTRKHLIVTTSIVSVLALLLLLHTQLTAESAGLARLLPLAAQTEPPGTVDESLQVTHGPMSGEVTAETAVLWARGSEAGELRFELASTDAFTDTLDVQIALIDEESDLTGETAVANLEPSTLYHYRVALTVGDRLSQYASGQFKTAPAATAEAEASGFSFVFGSCLGGQGYCRDPETGWYIFETMRLEQPDFMILTGDTIYGDSACTEPNNVPGSEGPFTDLDGFRSRYRYHLEDENYATFLRQTPVYVTWDDHEVIDDFGGPALSRLNPQLFADGSQAFFDYWPLSANDEGNNQIYRKVSYGPHADIFILDTRSYRDPNVNWDPNPRTLAPKTMLGAEQFAWLQDGLADSTATWKFIVTSTPLSYPTGFPQPEVDGRDGWANYSERSGYETELMSLLFFVTAQQVDNLIFLTGDTHHPFALSYDPDHDGTANFHEFGSSPISAINLPPVATPDQTFNPTVLYAEGEFQGTMFNFGQVQVDEAGNLTFRVVDRDGAERFATTLEPKAKE
jgi:alkaline phosphatase D